MENTHNNFRNLNDSLSQYTGTESYHKTPFGFFYTDGIVALFTSFETTSWWILDVILSYQPQLKNEDFQQWKVTKKSADAAVVICDDGNGKELVKQEIPFSDISGNCTIWVENNVIYLPSER
jgi:hypothetical protein